MCFYGVFDNIKQRRFVGMRSVIGLELARFTQLKRHERFADLFMLVRDQGSVFHIAAGSHPVQEAWGHKIVCTGVKFKSCFNDVKNHSNRFLL